MNEPLKIETTADEIRNLIRLRGRLIRCLNRGDDCQKEALDFTAEFTRITGENFINRYIPSERVS